MSTIPNHVPLLERLMERREKVFLKADILSIFFEKVPDFPVSDVTKVFEKAHGVVAIVSAPRKEDPRFESPSGHSDSMMKD
jgi:hypothetical protein